MSSTRDSSGEGKVICVWDLPPGLLTRKAIKSHFSKYGIVTQVVVNEENGTCQVSFATHDDAQYALISGNVWNDQNLRIFWMQSSYLDPRSTEMNLPQFEEDILWEDDDKECFGVEKSKKISELRRKSSKEIIKRHLKSSILPQKKHSDISKKGKEQWQSTFTVKKAKEDSTVLDKEKMFEKQRKIKTSEKDLSIDLSKKKISLGKFKKEKVTASRVTKTKKHEPESITNINENLPLLERTATNLKDKFTLLEERDKLLRNMLKTGSASKIRMKGTCPDMCPEKERIMRDFRHLVSVYETSLETNDMVEELAIKAYSRSSADQEEPLPHELRPAPVLTLTMNYLIRNIMERVENIDENMAEWYDFCWDRLRGIRKDIIQQQLCDVKTVTIVEQCARFHICCYDRLWGADASVFDEKINTENLMNCLQSLTHMYEDLSKQSITCPNEAEFKSYKILLQLDTGDIMWEYQQFSPVLQLSAPVQFAVKVHAAFHNRMYARFFNLVKKTTYLSTCLLQRYFHQVRSQALESIVKAYTRRTVNTSIPVKFIMTVLKFDMQEDTVEFCESHGVYLENNKSEFILSKKHFSTPETPVQTKLSSRLVSDKRLSISQAVVGESQSLPVYVPHKVHSSFDGQGRLHSSALDASDQAHTTSLLYKNDEFPAVKTNTALLENKKREPERVFKFALPEQPRLCENIPKLDANGSHSLVSVSSTNLNIESILSKSLPMPMNSMAVLETSDTGSFFNKNFQNSFTGFQKTLPSSDSNLSSEMECTTEEVDVLDGGHVNSDAHKNISFVSDIIKTKSEESMNLFNETPISNLSNGSWRFSFATDNRGIAVKKMLSSPLIDTGHGTNKIADKTKIEATKDSKCNSATKIEATNDSKCNSGAIKKTVEEAVIPVGLDEVSSISDSSEQKIKQQEIELKESKTEELERLEVEKQKWEAELEKLQEKQKWEAEVKKMQEKQKWEAEIQKKQEIEKRKTMQALKKDLRQRLKIISARICARRWKEKVARIKKSRIDFPVLMELSVKDHLDMWGTVGNRSAVRPSRVLQRLKKRNNSNIVVSKLIRFGLKNSVVYLGDTLAEMIADYYISASKKKTDIKSVYWKLVISIPYGISEETEIFNKQIKNWFKHSLYKDEQASFGSVQCTETALNVRVYTCIQVLENTLNQNEQKQVCHGMDSVLFIYVDGWEKEEESFERVSDIVLLNSHSTFSLAVINVGEHMISDKITSVLHKMINNDSLNNWIIQQWVGPESIQNGLVHLVRNINVRPDICTQPLKFLLLDVCEEFFDSLSAGQYTSYQLAKAVRTPNNVIRLFNICMLKLENMLISKKLEKCSLFAKEFKPFISTSEIPGGIEKFCGNSYDDTYKNNISKVLKLIKLSEFAKWPPRSNNRLIKVLKVYCLNTHNVSILPSIIRMINPQDENCLIDHLENINWISFVELWAKQNIIYNANILESKMKTKNFVIYDKNDIHNLTVQQWWLKTQIVSNYR